jgi:hypothetical protein
MYSQFSQYSSLSYIATFGYRDALENAQVETTTASDGPQDGTNKINLRQTLMGIDCDRDAQRMSLHSIRRLFTLPFIFLSLVVLRSLN